MDKENLRWRGRFTRYAPVILWLGVIFFLSSNNGSMAETSRFIRPLLQFLFPTAAEETLQMLHGYIRKAAHFSEYAILAFLALRALSRSSLFDSLRKFRFILSLILVAAVACFDELNQSFEASRTGSARDILLDISGGVVMVGLSLVFHVLRSRQNRTKKLKNG